MGRHSWSQKSAILRPEPSFTDHIWFWNGRKVRERAWLFLASPSDDARLSRRESPELIEADSQRIKTLWRPIQEAGQNLPPLCPPQLADFLPREHSSGIPGGQL